MEGPFGQLIHAFGRVLFAVIFVLSAFSNFSSQTIGYAAQHGVPAAGILVPLAGVISLLGGLSIAFGIYARVGALLIIIFLVPVTLTMHSFWTIADPMAHQLQEIMFLKNLSMLGGAFIIAYCGAGPVSIDAGMQKPTRV